MNQVFWAKLSNFNWIGYTGVHVGHLREIPPSRWVIVTCTTGFSWREAWGQAYLLWVIRCTEDCKSLKIFTNFVEKVHIISSYFWHFECICIWKSLYFNPIFFWPGHCRGLGPLCLPLSTAVVGWVCGVGAGWSMDQWNISWRGVSPLTLFHSTLSSFTSLRSAHTPFISSLSWPHRQSKKHHTKLLPTTSPNVNNLFSKSFCCQTCC